MESEPYDSIEYLVAGIQGLKEHAAMFPWRREDFQETGHILRSRIQLLKPTLPELEEVLRGFPAILAEELLAPNQVPNNPN